MNRMRVISASLFILLLAVAPVRQSSAQEASSEDVLRMIWSHGLGFYAVGVNPALAKDVHLEKSAGMLVLGVMKGGPANKAGMKRGDQVIGLTPMEAWSEKDKQATIKVLRGKEELSLQVNSEAALDMTSPLVEQAAPEAGRKAVQYSVDPQGGGDFRTLTGALYSALPGDRIVLQAGTYREAVLYPSGVSVRAAQKDEARVESPYMWFFLNVADAEISGIHFSFNGFLVTNAKNLKLSENEFVNAGEKPNGIVLFHSEGISITHCVFQGVGQENTLDATASGFRVTDSTISRAPKTAIQLGGGSKAEVLHNLLEGSPTGIVARDSELTASENNITGPWTPEEKSDGNFWGIFLGKSKGVVSRNSIRRERVGLFVSDGGTPAKITDNTVTQNGYGVVLFISGATVSGNLVLQNQNDGIFVGNMKNEAAKKPEGSSAPEAAKAQPPEVTLLRNTISENQGTGVHLEKSMSVTLRENLIESNGVGINVDSSGAAIENNTVVLQRATGIMVGPGSDVSVYNNIVAFNSFGLFLDVSVKLESGYNDVFGNLASTEFPLRDGNYGRTDRYATRDGKKVPLQIYPAYDLKAATDLSVDPGFVKMGSDYTLKPASALARTQGKGQHHIGAYEPVAAKALPASTTKKPS
jgi:parallel beta-helix repeat protein